MVISVFQEQLNHIDSQIDEYRQQIAKLSQQKQDLEAKTQVANQALETLQNALNVLGAHETFRTAVVDLLGNVPTRTEEQQDIKASQEEVVGEPEPPSSAVTAKKPETMPTPEVEPLPVASQVASAPPPLPPEPKPGESHTLLFATSKHNGSTTFLVVGQEGNKYECLNTKGQRLKFPAASLNFLAPTQTQIPADFVQFKQPLPEELVSDAVWGRIKLLSARDKGELQEAKSRVKGHQDGLLGSLGKYWLTDEERLYLEEVSQKEPKKELHGSI